MHAGACPRRFFVQKKREARAEKMKAKGKAVDMDELIRMEPDRGVTNVRKLNLPHWTRWFGVDHRCSCPSPALPNRIQASKQQVAMCPTWFARERKSR